MCIYDLLSSAFKTSSLTVMFAYLLSYDLCKSSGFRWSIHDILSNAFKSSSGSPISIVSSYLSFLVDGQSCVESKIHGRVVGKSLVHSLSSG